MKLVKIFGIVLTLHVLVFAFLFIFQGCATTSEEEGPPPSDAPVTGTEEAPAGDHRSGRLHPDFNAGMEIESPTSAPAGRGKPTRPTWDFEPMEPEGEVLRPLHSVGRPPTSLYVVKRGDTLSQIAREHGIPLADLLEANGFDGQTVIHPEQTLLLPAPAVPSVEVPEAVAQSAPGAGVPYTVQTGDTLSGIAQRFGTTVSWLKRANGRTKDLIQIGETLILPEYTSTGGGASGPQAERAVAPVRGEGLREAMHVVVAGENPSGIARIYGMSAGELMAINGITDPTKLRIGQTLIVRRPEERSGGADAEGELEAGALRVREADAIPGIEEMERSYLEEEEAIPVIPVETEDGPN